MLSIIMPIYNEQSSVVEALAKITDVMSKHKIQFELIVVNDGSNDNSSKVLSECGLKFRLFNHEKNEGYGAAIKTGMRQAVYDYIAIIDGDGTYPAEKIPQMFANIKQYNYDMVVGARTGSNVHIPVMRVLAKWCVNKLANYLSGTKIPDLNSGLRIIKKEMIEKYVQILPNGFSFTTTITLALLTNEHRVGYVPIDYYKRAGKSKIRPISDTLNFVSLIVRTIMYFNPLKVFIPLSFVLFITSCAMLIYRATHHGGFSVISVILFVLAVQVLTTGMIADLIEKRSKF